MLDLIPANYEHLVSPVTLSESGWMVDESLSFVCVCVLVSFVDE